MPTTPFHPIIDTWFKERLGSATEPQRLGWPHIAAGEHTLIAAPTGSGKTLAAFLGCIDGLLKEAIAGQLPETTQVVYISPLKALSNDIRRNLEGPLEEIQAAAAKAGFHFPKIRAQVRTGDTPQSERAAMLRKPPHILVTTPESLYLVLTSPRSRRILTSVKTVIVDEIHALARDKRGSHMSLTLERLESLCVKPPVRIGLSATQKPLEDIAHFLVGTRKEAVIVDSGHLRELDLGIELPNSDLAAVCSTEQWDEVYEKLAKMVESHRSTLIFVNTRRMAERLSHHLRERLGTTAVASHHGSLSRDTRWLAEDRLKKGELKAIVATASLELGIDVGYIDLVCQIGSPRSIATFLQRVGRSGHHLGAKPKGRLIALTRDELHEALSLLRAIRNGRLDLIEMPRAPLDVLAQQIVAEVSCRDSRTGPRDDAGPPSEGIPEDDLYQLVTGAWPYRHLPRNDFNDVIALVSDGVAVGRPQGAYLHRDAVHHEVRARRAARLTALTCGGAIPETADYKVVMEDDGTVVGSVNEDFAVESLAGDVFMLGNTSWRVRFIRSGQVIVSDAQGAPANVPFWLGEAPGRTRELSEELSMFREELEQHAHPGNEAAAIAWLQSECQVNESIAEQAVVYAAAQIAAVGFLPTMKRVLFERFFDQSGGMQLVIHAPFGSRINRAWGLALRKRFCRTFDFELQASADDNGIVLSLGPQHSFPLEELFKMLRPDKARETLIQALLAAPMFQLRWRWNLTRAMAVQRTRGGKKVPPPLLRFRCDDLLSAVFPLQTACFEHRPPEVPLPDHPLIRQTIDDCLHEAMDVDRWEQVLSDIAAGRIALETRDTREPSPFSHSILNANVYSFLDDAPLEERRARAVTVRRSLSLEETRDLARLDRESIAQVKAEAWPFIRDADELHDALLSMQALPESEALSWRSLFDSLVTAGRAARALRVGRPTLWLAAERTPLVQAAFSGSTIEPPVELPEELKKRLESLEARVALLRGRLSVVGPVTAQKCADDFGLDVKEIEAALTLLEAEGFALQGRFTEFSLKPGASIEWCERRLLTRIHRLTLEGARRQVQAVTPDVYWRFLTEMHHVLPGSHREGALGVHEALGQLQGTDIPAGAWESDILSTRVENYQPEWLDQLTFSGELTWGRMQPPHKDETLEPGRAGLTRVVPISFAYRADLPWLLPTDRTLISSGTDVRARPDALKVYAALKESGALFFEDLEQATGLLAAALEEALSELSALGVVTADGFAAIRYVTRHKKNAQRRSQTRWRSVRLSHRGGRWTRFPGRVSPATLEDRLQQWAWQLLRRYGIVFRDLLTRENTSPSWWELVSIYRRMEARGEVRGGRFVTGVGGEQYALAEAVESLRRPRATDDDWAVISAADPLNLTGILSKDARVPATRGNRLLLHNGKLAATLQTGEIRIFEAVSDSMKEKISRVLRLTQLPTMREALLKDLSTAPASH